MKLYSKMAMILAIVMVFALLLPACAQTDNGQTSTENSTTATAEKKLIELTVLGITIADFGKDDLGKKIESDLNVKITPISVDWSDADQQVKLLASSDQTPDWFLANFTADIPWIYSWADQGIIREIPQSIIDKYPYAKKAFDPSTSFVANAMKENLGAYYGFPVLLTKSGNWKYAPGGSGWIYRKDWMANVGITKVPETIDEVTQMARAFATGDPDKNGKVGDTGGFLFGDQTVSPICNIWGVDIGSWGVDTDGKVKPAYVTDKMLAPLKWLHDAFQEKIIDPEMMQNKGIAQQQSKWSQDKFGITTVGGDLSNINRMIGPKGWAGAHNFACQPPDYVGEKEVGETFGLLAPIKKDANTPATWAKQLDENMSFVSSKVNDEKLDRIAEIYDYFLKPENSDLFALGFENVHWKNVNGQPEFLTDPATGNPYDPTVVLSSASIAWLATWDKEVLYRIPNKAPVIKEMCKTLSDQYSSLSLIDTNTSLAFISTPAKNSLTIDYIADLDNIITDSKPVEETFPAFVQKCMDSGLSQAIFEVTNKAKKLNLLK